MKFNLSGAAKLQLLVTELFFTIFGAHNVKYDAQGWCNYVPGLKIQKSWKLKVRVPGGLACSQASCAIDQINPKRELS